MIRHGDKGGTLYLGIEIGGTKLQIRAFFSIHGAVAQVQCPPVETALFSNRFFSANSQIRCPMVI
jgi:hypothetical protein